MSHNDFEGPLGDGGVIVWDRGTYEQGGRVPWPEALERGHAVFVLHGEKLRGGFALQRTRRAAPSRSGCSSSAATTTRGQGARRERRVLGGLPHPARPPAVETSGPEVESDRTRSPRLREQS